MPDWVEKAYFGAVCYVGNKNRQKRLVEEIVRIGIQDYHIYWSFPSPYRDKILRQIPHIAMLDKRPGCWGATLTHYKILKTAYELGYEHAFIVEDDCRFLKDVSTIWDTINSAPCDADILMLDSFTRRGYIRNCSAGWYSCESAESSASYIVNRRAMSALIDLYESPVSGKYRNPIMRASDHWTNRVYLGNAVKFYVAIPNLAIQVNIGDRTNCGQHTFQEYERMGLNLNLYSNA